MKKFSRESVTKALVLIRLALMTLSACAGMIAALYTSGSGWKGLEHSIGIIWVEGISIVLFLVSGYFDPKTRRFEFPFRESESKKNFWLKR